MSDFNTEMNFALKEIQGSTGFSLDRNRDYDGQPHTDSGTRGKTEVKGLTMRDVSDCIVLAFLDSAGFMGLEIKNPIHDDIYKIDLEKIDLRPGNYTFTIAVMTPGAHNRLARISGVAPFIVTGSDVEWAPVIRRGRIMTTAGCRDLQL